MDYAERGTVEKTLDRLLEDEEGLAEGLDSQLNEFVSDGEITREGQVYLTGLLSGILATVRTFSEGESGFDDEDFEEINRIASSRQAEILAALSAETE